MTSTPNPPSTKIIQWWVDLIQRLAALTPVTATTTGSASSDAASAKDDAKNRLRLVLLHDRTQLSPSLLESMRDELVAVIAKYVEIDQTTLDLCLEKETNTIALVANIAVVRAKEPGEQTVEAATAPEPAPASAS